MSMKDGLDRRSVMFGMAGAVASVLTAPSRAASAAGAATAREVFSVQSPTAMLTGEAQGFQDAPEILLVHGLRQSRLSWEKQFTDPVLARFRLVAFDLRGHGDSDKPDSLDSYADADRWADDIAAVIVAAKLRRPVLVGWSLGGWAIGAYLRKRGGARIAGVNLVDALTMLSPDLFAPLAGEFTRTATSHDLAVRTASTAEFLSACFHRRCARTAGSRSTRTAATIRCASSPSGSGASLPRSRRPARGRRESRPPRRPGGRGGACGERRHDDRTRTSLLSELPLARRRRGWHSLRRRDRRRRAAAAASLRLP